MLETVLANLPLAAILGVVAGLLRNVGGFLENALKDGRIDSYEWKQLVGTIVKYFVGILLLSMGMPIETAVAGTFVMDVSASAVKKAGRRK